MFSYALSTVTTHFYLPIDEEQDTDIETYERKYLTWTSELSSAGASLLSPPQLQNSFDTGRTETVKEILGVDNLYDILGVTESSTLDRLALRRAYLSRSRACHPDKFPNNPDATRAFQKVAVAYDILSKPSSRRLYDSRSSSSSTPFDVFATQPPNHADETFRGVIIGIFNDFLDGDLEVIRTLLKAINDINPSVKLGDDGIDTVLTTLESIRERVLACRTCIYTLHAELSRLLEVQHAFRRLSYFDIQGRSRLTIQLTRITLSLPIALERALRDHNSSSQNNATKAGSQFVIVPRHVSLLIRSVDQILDRMERILN